MLHRGVRTSALMKKGLRHVEASCNDFHAVRTSALMKKGLRRIGNLLSVMKSVRTSALMKKGLRLHRSSPKANHNRVRTSALMKKGLRRHLQSVISPLGCPNVRPDEEGIKTFAGWRLAKRIISSERPP